MHEYVSLRDLLAALLTDRDSLQQALKQCGEALMRASAWVESSPLRAHCNAVLDIPLVREAMTQQEKAATDSGDSFRSRNAAKSDPDAGGK
jgi:hypothetical protein